MNRSLRFFTKGDKLAGCKSRRKRRCGCPDDDARCNDVDVSWEFIENESRDSRYITITVTVSGIPDDQVWSVTAGPIGRPTSTKTTIGSGQIGMNVIHGGRPITWMIVSQSDGDNASLEYICPFEYTGTYIPTDTGSGSGSGPGPEPGLFRCNGPGMVTITVDEGVGEGAHVSMLPNTFYFAVRKPNGEVEIISSSLSYIFHPNQGGFGAGTYCVWPSDAEGEYSEESEVYQLIISGPGVSFIAPEFPMALGGYTQFNSLSNTSIDLSGFPSTGIYNLYNCPSLEEITGYNMANVMQFDAYDCALNQATVDDILVAAAATGNPISVNLSGGTSSPPSAVGLAAAATIISNGGTVYHN